MKKGKKILAEFVFLFFLICEVLFLILLHNLKMVPFKFFIPIALVLLVITLVLFFMSLKRKTVNKAIILMLILMIVFIIGSYFLGRTLVFLSRMIAEPEKTEDYHIVVIQDSEYIPEPIVVEPTFKDKVINFLYPVKVDPNEEVLDKATVLKIDEISEILNEKTVGTFLSKDKNYSQAKGAISESAKLQYTYEKNELELYNKLLDGTYDFILLSDISYQILKDQNPDLMEKTDILYTLKFEIEKEEQRMVDVTKDSFNILLSGSDFFGKFASDTIHRSDVDMIVTVNPTTHQVHLTSIPRDYYVILHSYGEYDKLTHSSLKGVDELKHTIEDTLGIEIDYFVRANFNAVVRFINAIGGLDVYSEKAFTLVVEGEYYSYSYNKYISEGINHLDGAETLSFCRARQQFGDGDLQRIRNQQAALEAVLKKATSSTTILTNYLDILNALEGRIETDMSLDDMGKLINMQLNEMPSWEISKRAIKAEYGWGICYLAQYYGELNVALQDETENAMARDDIYKVLAGRIISGEEEETEEGTAN